MLLICTVLLCFLVPITFAGWLRDLISPQGLDVGSGLILHLYGSQRTNASLLDRHVIKMDYHGYGLSVAKAPKKDALQVGLYTNSLGEGRANKQYSVLKVIIGYKAAMVAAAMVSLTGALVLKALFLAKISAVTSLILLISKLFHREDESHHQTPSYVEIEHGPELHSGFAEFSPGAEFHPSGSSDYYQYANYGPSGIAAMVTGVGNSSVAADQQVATRREASRKTNRIPLVTIRQYSKS